MEVRSRNSTPLSEWHRIVLLLPETEESIPVPLPYFMYHLRLEATLVEPVWETSRSLSRFVQLDSDSGKGILFISIECDLTSDAEALLRTISSINFYAHLLRLSKFLKLAPFHPLRVHPHTTLISVSGTITPLTKYKQIIHYTEMIILWP
jgi:hypothetical protein